VLEAALVGGASSRTLHRADIKVGENVDIVGDAHRLTSLFKAGQFDFAYSISVFEHLLWPWKVALELNTDFKNRWRGAEPIASDLAAARSAVGFFSIFCVRVGVIILQSDRFPDHKGCR
jgi:hypothetical protein